MSEQHDKNGDKEAGDQAAPRDAKFWAQSVSQLDATDVPEGGINRNVAGREITAPMSGFGKMWQRSYRMHIPGRAITPREVIKEWKANFGSFWPSGSKFYGPFTAISPGDIAVLNLKAVGRAKLSTGVYVMYADDESFTFSTPQGHMFAGWITFNAAEDREGTLVQVQVLVRSWDPIWEMGMPIMKRMEDKFWIQTLRNVGTHFGINDAPVNVEAVCLDKKRQWKRAKNVWYNAGVRTAFYYVGAPGRAVRRSFKRNDKPADEASIKTP